MKQLNGLSPPSGVTYRLVHIWTRTDGIGALPQLYLPNKNCTCDASGDLVPRLCWMCTPLLISYSFHSFYSSGTVKADGSAEADGKEPVTLTAAEASRASEARTTPEPQDLPAERSEGELDCSAMEVE